MRLFIINFTSTGKLHLSSEPKVSNPIQFFVEERGNVHQVMGHNNSAFSWANLIKSCVSYQPIQELARHKTTFDIELFLLLLCLLRQLNRGFSLVRSWATEHSKCNEINKIEWSGLLFGRCTWILHIHRIRKRICRLIALDGKIRKISHSLAGLVVHKWSKQNMQNEIRSKNNQLKHREHFVCHLHNRTDYQRISWPEDYSNLPQRNSYWIKWTKL